MDDDDLLWLSTRDGSPTLWNNRLSESYRSLRGAFTESYWAFVRPALDFAKNQTRTLQIGEFGLGLGTNWLLWTQLATALKIRFEYSAIEKEIKTFEMGLVKWKSEFEIFERFALKHGFTISQKAYLDGLSNPPISLIPSPNDLTKVSKKFDVWFHDPFGAEVNPDGYSLDTLQRIAPLWSGDVRGFSYACNRVFQDGLRTVGMEVEVVDFEEPIGKRSRLQFRRKA